MISIPSLSPKNNILINKIKFIWKWVRSFVLSVSLVKEFVRPRTSLARQRSEGKLRKSRNKMAAEDENNHKPIRIRYSIANQNLRINSQSEFESDVAN